MQLIRLDENLKELPPRDVVPDEVLQELNLIALNATRTYEHGEEAISKTSLTLARSESDFLTLDCHSPDEVHFSSDRLCRSDSWVERFFAGKDALQFRASKDRAKQVIIDYFSLPRVDFESKYSEMYANSRTSFYRELE